MNTAKRSRHRVFGSGADFLRERQPLTIRAFESPAVAWFACRQRVEVGQPPNARRNRDGHRMIGRREASTPARRSRASRLAKHDSRSAAHAPCAAPSTLALQRAGHLRRAKSVRTSRPPAFSSRRRRCPMWLPASDSPPRRGAQARPDALRRLDRRASSILISLARAGRAAIAESYLSTPNPACEHASTAGRLACRAALGREPVSRRGLGSFVNGPPVGEQSATSGLRHALAHGSSRSCL